MINTIGIWVAALLTLAIYSFLYKDNAFYKIAENIFVGVSAGYWAVVLWYDFAWPNLFEPLLTRGQWYNIFPIFIGVLMFAPLIPKISWMIRIPLTFTMGVAMAVSITQFVQGDIFPQLQATFLPLSGVSLFKGFSNLLIILGVVFTLIYFYFSKEHKGVLGIGAKIGIWFMMVSFGASFGYTIMARVSLFIGRIYFLLHHWLGVI
uniref:Uncharacterized protein n=1 Tax=candidate division WOR-3 bacterium TaxID=2052148 RepID=A0A7C4THX7_UNCW3